ncbi:hypothetical protein [Wenzhouxiangella limi]|uniref:General secretion pathway protein GspK n=1 Tax=Wenzhouxiangella limi TaxID=2707351 RepID=A0A845UWU0_9GAMM|nr:hypothetical protein [Wenzhouxiangella limi]NDY96323.1 hypothetical protein [Wenzhouxiangella limi]
MKRKAQGFILALVLAVLVALSLLVSAIAAWVSATMRQSIDFSDMASEQIAHHDTLETLKYFMATRLIGIGGIYMGPYDPAIANSWRSTPANDTRLLWRPDDLPLDNRPLLAFDKSVFRIQDEAGLIKLKNLDTASFASLLQLMDVRGPQRDRLARQLVTTILAPPDSLAGRSIAAAFRAGGVVAPSARYPLSPFEVLHQPGWEQLGPTQIALWNDGVSPLARGRLNLNSAPPWLLPVLPFMNASTAQTIVEQRASRPVAGPGGLDNAVLDPLHYQGVPGTSFRITFPAVSSRRALRYHLRMTPQAHRAQPWQLEMTYPVTPQTSHSSSAPPDPQIIDHPLFASPEESTAGRQ